MIFKKGTTIAVFLSVLLLIFSHCSSDTLQWEELKYSEGQWRYKFTEEAKIQTWQEADFKDDDWSNITEYVPLENFQEDENTFLYCRIHFSVNQIENIKQLLIQLPFNAEAVAYLNGEKVIVANKNEIRNNYAIEKQTDTNVPIYAYWNKKNYFFSVDELEKVLLSKENVLCVKLTNDKIKNVDLAQILVSVGHNGTKGSYSDKQPDFSPKAFLKESTLPVIFINTNGETIIDEPEIEAELHIKEKIAQNPNTQEEYKISIDVRGNTSQTFAKQSYGFRFLNEKNKEKDVELLGMPEDPSWVLYGPWADMSLQRNKLVYDLSRNMGWYAARSRYCELVINNDYRGIYLVMEKLKKGSARINITPFSKSDSLQRPDQGGYLLEINNGSGDWWHSNYPVNEKEAKKVAFWYKYPSTKSITDSQKKYIQNYLHLFEKALYYHQDSTHLNYKQYIDIQSFVDYFILNEFSRNIDAYRTSVFLYKDADTKGGKIIAGPVWDYNFSLGLPDYLDGYKTDGWVYNKLWDVSFWWKKFLEDPEFTALLKKRWGDLRKNELDSKKLHRAIDNNERIIEEALERNFTKWPVWNASVWPNVRINESYQQEIDSTKAWIDHRMEWLDQNIPRFP